MRFLLCCFLFGVAMVTPSGLAAITSASNLGVVDTRRPIMQMTAARQVDTRPLGMMLIVR
ncbi:MAG: hypothetical protein Q4G65_07590 [bacterium]|nr:hypothetical protein [bacterium]